MKGIIIAGGFGTRLRPLTLRRPKHMLPVANRPFLEYQVALLKQHQIRDIVFASNYLWEQIQAHFGDGSAFGVSLRYALEPEPLGTAGAIRNAAESLPDERVIVLNGDVLTDFDLGKIIEFHIDRRASATIALRAVQRPHAFGVLAAESDGRVTAWREPTEEEKKRAASGQAEQAEGTDFINAGIYVLEPEFVSRIPTGRFVSIERETYQYAIAEGLRVFATAPPGFWLDIGNPRQYLAANQAVLSGAVQTEVAFSAFGPSVMLEPLAKVDAMTAVGPGTVIGAGAVIEGSVLLEDIRVGSGARIHEAIVDAGAVIPPDKALETGSVITGESYPADPPPSAMAL